MASSRWAASAAERSWRASAMDGLVPRLADGGGGPLEDLVGERRIDEDARLVLQHARAQRREDRRYAVLVQLPHHNPGTLWMVELEPDDHAILPDADEPVGVRLPDLAEAAREALGQLVDPFTGGRPVAELQGLQRRDAAELGATERRHVRETVLGEPTGTALAHQYRRDGIDPARQALAGDQDVRRDAVLADGPQLAGAHEPGLH